MPDTQGWVKIYRSITGDTAIRQLSATKRWQFVCYILMAQHKGEWVGHLVDDCGRPYTTDERAAYCGLDRSNLWRHDKDLIKKGLITMESGGRMRVTNYDKYQQSVVKPQQKPVVKSQQEPVVKPQSVVNPVVNNQRSLQQDHAQNVGGRSKEVKNIPPTTTEQACLDVLQSVANYPYDEAHDLETLRRYAQDFPTVDMLKELKAWSAYKLDHPLKPKQAPRSQIHKWLSNSVIYTAQRQARRNGNGRHSENNSVQNAMRVLERIRQEEANGQG